MALGLVILVSRLLISDGAHVPLVEAKQLSPHKFYYAYKPTHTGRHDVAILYGGSAIAQSPFPVSFNVLS